MFMSVDCGGYVYESIYAVCLVSVMCKPPDMPVNSLLEAMHYVCRPKEAKFDINKKLPRKFCLFNPNVEYTKIVSASCVEESGINLILPPVYCSFTAPSKRHVRT